MPRPRPPFLQRAVTRHGRVAWYVRRDRGPRLRLRSAYGSPEFEREYQAAIAGTPKPAPRGESAGTVAWLIARYRETTAWRDLSMATRKQRENIFKGVLKTAGHESMALAAADIIAGRDRRAATPYQARHFLDALRGLYRWAHAAGLVRQDPTLGVAPPKTKKGPGFPRWTEDDVAAYERRWPIGTKERVWFDVLCYTGGRRGDAAVIGRQHVRDGVATFRTEKSRGKVTVTIPILPVLARTLAAGPCGDLTFIVGARGKPLTKESFGNAFSEAARAAGIAKSAHGVRKIAAIRAALNGATLAQLNALFGWTGTSMALHYTQEADRIRLAGAAAHMLAPRDQQNDSGTSMPSPRRKVRASERKDQ
ncbi:tyrosine-type recombinase/integrase [Bradyrhizobium sp.]|uniref:tyrosine-type recombinase/integrase n=1 Tax=Bradyrhizobium sp. TaxID=376 RepID=UPI0025C295EF|nr:tyrosine-type recombinase/integrase [Bradyrhizobium sp.]